MNRPTNGRYVKIAAAGEASRRTTRTCRASILGESPATLVRDIAVSGDGAGGLVNAMIARMLSGPTPEQTPRE